MLDERTIPDAQLPAWMQQARRGVDWGVIIVMILSIFVAWPLIVNRHLPAHTALENYAFQVNDASTSILQGWFFPRWSATALNGYGTPLPHYQPSAAADVAAIINVLFLNDVERVIRLAMIAAFLLAGSTTYVFVMQRSGAQAGVLAAALYLFSPYVALMSPYVRGDLPEVFSLAAMPTLLWAVNRLLQRNQPLDSLTIALSTAFLALNDPAWLLLSLLPLAALISHDLAENKQWQRIPVISGSMLLGIAMASFFWLPALLEQDFVRWLPPLVQTRTDSISFLGLFARTDALDPAALAYYPQWTLGWGALLFLMVGTTAAIVQKQHTGLQRHFLMLGSGLILLVVLAFPQEHRFMGVIAYCLAIGSSGAIQLLRHVAQWQAKIIVPTALFALIGIAYPVWVIVPDSQVGRDYTPVEQIRYEQAGYGIAVIPPGQLIPTTLTDSALAELRPIDIDEAASAINRFTTTPSSSVQILPTTRNPVSPIISANQPTTIGMHFSAYSLAAVAEGVYPYAQSYFPGWYGVLESERIELEREADRGISQIRLPSVSNGRLLIQLGTTPPRLIGWLVSLVALLTLVGYTAFRWRTVPGSQEVSILLRRDLARRLMIVVILAVVLRIFPNLNPLRGSLAPQPTYTTQSYLRYPNIYDGTIDLVQYCYTLGDLQEVIASLPLIPSTDPCRPRSSYAPGDEIDVSLIWEQSEANAEQIKVQLRLISGVSDAILVEEALRYPGHLPTNRWQPGRYMPDWHHFQLPTDISPGAYTLAFELYRCEPSAPGLYPACETMDVQLALPEPIVLD